MSRRDSRPTRPQKKRGRRRITEALGYLALITVIILIVSLYYSSSQRAVKESVKPEASVSQAAIVDQLGAIYPNQDFIQSAYKDLSSAGFKVRIYMHDEVTIDFYRSLPSRGYKIIVFRVHSAIPLKELVRRSYPIKGEPVFLFTNEPYDKNRYLAEQLTDQIVQVQVTNSSPSYFGIGPEFVKQSMTGRFPKTLIILSSCAGLYSTDLADALMERGASAIVSWNVLVELSQTDKAIAFLLKELCVEQLNLKQAVETTMSTVGPDPKYGATLLYYPAEAWDLSIKNLEAVEASGLSFHNAPRSLSAAVSSRNDQFDCFRFIRLS